MTDKISEWFTPIILLVAVASGIYHFPAGIGKSIEIICAVLIVACPCALALAAPFTFGHATRWLGRQKCYLREASVLEELANITHIIFDKTGTLTVNNQGSISYSGEPLNDTLKAEIYSLVNQSTHPLSRLLKAHFDSSQRPSKYLTVSSYEEIEGKGIQGEIDGIVFRLGASKWITEQKSETDATEVLVERDGKYIGRFTFENEYRQGLEGLIGSLSNQYTLSLISGDNDGQKSQLATIFSANTQLLFNQSPKEKLQVIKSLNEQNYHTMMVGDGLNDAGALREAKVGVSIAEDVNAFSPACDIIVGAENFGRLNQFLSLAKSSRNVVIASFVISFLYNILGLSFAVQGKLSPVFAAILMPISSVTVVGFVSIAVNARAWWLRRV